jgi:MFS family permease
VALVIGLALAGLGLGTFTPPNNASIMSAAPGGRTGLVGGMLNMTRGAGTALGVAIATVIYTAAAGVSRADVSSAGVASAGHGLTITMAIMAALAMAAGLTLAFQRRRRDHPATTSRSGQNLTHARHRGQVRRKLAAMRPLFASPLLSRRGE